MRKQHMYILAWLGQVMGKKKRYILYLLFLQAFLGISSVLSALLFRSLVDCAVSKNGNGFVQAAVWLGLLVIGQMAVGAMGRFLHEWVGATLENQLREKLFSCLLGREYASVAAVHSGEWMNRLTSDAGVVAGGIIEIVPGLTGLVVRLTGALAALFLLEPVFMAILIPGGCVMLVLTYGFRRVLKRLHKRIQEADGEVRIFLQEHIENLLIVRSFGMEERTREGAAEKMGAHRKARLRRNHLSNLCHMAFGLAANGIYLFGAVYCGCGILRGTVSYGTMTAILQLIGQVQSPFANLTGYLPRYYAMIASAERLMEAEGYGADDGKNHISDREIQLFYREKFAGMGFRNVSFGYGHSREMASERPLVLEQFGLEIKKGEYVAFTGRSGCGKSTILKLLMSLYPLDAGERYLKSVCQGEKRMEPEAEQPLDASWRGLFAYVPQGNQLMSGTVREVVAFGDPAGMKREEQLKDALRIACAEEFVNSLPDGLDTVLGERGSGLSEGQMQRIAIARAVFSGHPILLLDEATSALDEVTEQRLLANLRAMTDKTVLIVTHRPAVLEICDKQVIL